MKNLILAFFFTLSFACLTAQTAANQSIIFFNLRSAATFAQAKNAELDARPTSKIALGAEVLIQLKLGERFRYGAGIGVDYLGLGTAVNEVLLFDRFDGNGPQPIPSTLFPRARLYYLNIPLVLEYAPLKNKPDFFLSARSDFSLSLGGNSPIMLKDGNVPFGLVPGFPEIQQPDFAHFLSFGVGYRANLGSGSKLLRINPYTRFATTNVLEYPDSPEGEGGRHYWRETGLLEFGVQVGVTF